MIRLGLNIDHVATLRNARGGSHPDPIAAALLAEKAGVDGITVHLREDRRHIKDEDVARLMEVIQLPLNLEMAATEEMQQIALKHKPNAVCLVPEKREELTTEGGLDIVGKQAVLADYIKPLKEAGIRISLFVDPAEEQLRASKAVGADIVELHTGAFCEEQSEARLEALKQAAQLTEKIELECHAGHGLDYKTAEIVAAIPQIVELNIGHFMIGEAVMYGLEKVIHNMRASIQAGVNKR